MKLFQALMPKEERFIDYFRAHSEKIVAAAEDLHQMMVSGNDIQSHCLAIYTMEGEADIITRDTLLAIHRTFITPFDRVDIHGLISAMDDTIDLVEKTAQKIEMYEITDFTDEMKQMSESARNCAVIISQTVMLLAAINKNSRQINEMCVKVSKIKGEADHLLRSGLTTLIKSEADPIIIMTRKEIYELIESVIDRGDDVMNFIQGIVIEQV